MLTMCFPRFYLINSSRELNLYIVDHESDKENVYCMCQGTSKGCMIACDNIRCKYHWFHYKCVDIKCAPRGHGIVLYAKTCMNTA